MKFEIKHSHGSIDVRILKENKVVSEVSIYEITKSVSSLMSERNINGEDVNNWFEVSKENAISFVNEANAEEGNNVTKIK